MKYFSALGDSLADSSDAVKLRDHLATLSNWSMAAIAACIVVMAWSLYCLGFNQDPSGTRVAAIATLAASMAGAIVLGVLTTTSAAKLGQFSVELSGGDEE